MPHRISGVRGEFLWEWEIAERQLMQLARAFPTNAYEWRPNASARCISEILVHIACGTFMLLEQLGIHAPGDLFPDLPTPTLEHFWAFLRRNDEMEQTLRDKDQILSLLARVFDSARDAVTRMDDTEMERALFFFKENTTVRRVFLRLLAHTHEHMGQLIGFMRMRGMSAPWPDWRPDRREG